MLAKAAILIALFLQNLDLLTGQVDSIFSKTYSFQLYKQRSILSIESYVGRITGNRTTENIKSNISDCTIFLECDVNINYSNNGSLQVSSLDTNTWFIPLNLGTEPIKLLPGKCIRMECIDRPQYLNDCPPYKIIQLNDRLTVIGDVYLPCSSRFRCSLAYTHCDSILPNDMYNAGVIIKAKSIQIRDPEWFKPVPPLIFEIDSNGNMIRQVLQKAKD